MQAFTEDAAVTTGARGGVLWRSLRAGMEARGYNEATLARALSDRTGRPVTPRTVDSWLRGARRPQPDTLRVLAILLRRNADSLLADMPPRCPPPEKNLPRV